MLRTSSVRVLDDRDRAEATSIIAKDPVANVFVGSRVDVCGLDSWRLGAEMWGFPANGPLTALCYAGANMVPVGADEAASRAFADRAKRGSRRCSSLVGPAAQIASLWGGLESSWGPARDVRLHQPLMAIDHDPDSPDDQLVRAVRPDELDVVLPACIAMFTEEVGVSPVEIDGGALYRARVAELIRMGRAFAHIEDGKVLFKAEIGAATHLVCQVQGVWVSPELRGQGRGTAGTAAVVKLARARIAPTVSLYVNDYNTAARRAYERIGMREVGELASILF
ncbi:MAG: GCN5-related N-acetyltransferase [Frankiales bacterium]|nr:GCN5-related N-acetyltransferase [Frankiales bacterium]